MRPLREVVGEPQRAAGEKDVREAPQRLAEMLGILRSRKLPRTLTKRLVELGVDTELVRRDWQDRISKIGALRSARDVHATYGLRGRRYRVPVDAGFDPASGIFWIKGG